MKRGRKSAFWIILAAWLVLGSTPFPRAEEKSQGASPPGQEKSTKDQKKKGSFFRGLKAVAGQSSEQQGETATAGTKGVGEGEQIANLQPSAADRQAVTAMEEYSVSASELKQFQEEGKLKPQQ
jgi:hypothetical protein